MCSIFFLFLLLLYYFLSSSFLFRVHSFASRRRNLGCWWEREATPPPVFLRAAPVVKSRGIIHLFSRCGSFGRHQV